MSHQLLTKYFQYRSICSGQNRHDKCCDHHNIYPRTWAYEMHIFLSCPEESYFFRAVLKRMVKLSLTNANEAANSGFETQRRHYQKSTTGLLVAP